MRVIIEISRPLTVFGNSVLTARKLADITDWRLISVRDMPFHGVTIYTIQAEVSPTQLRDLEKAGYMVERLV